ncbi:unnamed protein product [Dibothriocephalus latus]|uniref:N-alpha-acetyltransferase 20 n=1 Tax=Dibothriocephalus latus TaxID=60516 RepID=A0A3P6T746_DIBLA|nr:unnamed protein product [Dibothriocephalus latus]
MITWPEYMRVVESPILTCFSARKGCSGDSALSTSIQKMRENVTSLGGRIMGYMVAKSEGQGPNWHGHVTALSVAPEYRRVGLAGRLMKGFEDTSERKACYFLDLFVRASNELGHNVYKKMGYVIYRRVLNYYSGKDDDEDAFGMPFRFSNVHISINLCDLPVELIYMYRIYLIHIQFCNNLDMRKALSRDVERKSVVPLKRPVKPEDLEFN